MKHDEATITKMPDGVDPKLAADVKLVLNHVVAVAAEHGLSLGNTHWHVDDPVLVQKVAAQLRASYQRKMN